MQLISLLKLFSRNCYLENQFLESVPARSRGRAQHHVVVVVSQIQCHWVFMNQRHEIGVRELG